jgi:hypothetical protein
VSRSWRAWFFCASADRRDVNCSPRFVPDRDNLLGVLIAEHPHMRIATLA